MFSNLNWYNLVVLLLLALFIFGDKLPQVISDLFRMLRNLRRMAQNATSDLSRELGTDIRVEDLHPRTFVRKHLLSESEQETLTRPVKGLSEELWREGRGLQDEFQQARSQTQAAVDDATGAARTRPRRTAGGESRQADRSGPVSPAPDHPPAPEASEPAAAPPTRLRFDDVT